jgi:hypothetical protein
MKPPRIDRFDAKQKIKPEPVDFTGIPALAQKPAPLPQSVQSQEANPLPPTSAPSLQAPLDQTINQSINPSMNRFMNQPRNRPMQKPVGFYISPQLDERLDTAVRYYKERHGFPKVDRSVVLNALLESSEHWTAQALDLLTSRIITVLTRKLTG